MPISLQGLVVQNLTRLLANMILKFVLKYGKYIDIFAEKNVSRFWSKKINVFENTFATTVNNFIINKLFKLTML